MSKHTPTPWIYNVVGIGGRHDNPVDVCEIHTHGYHKRIAEHVVFDDAELICRAVNSHDALVEALQEIVDYQGGADSACQDEYVMDRARAALRAAGVEP